MINGNLDRTAASRIVRSLRNGVTPSEYASEIRVGQDKWVEVALQMMGHTSEDQDFEVRFVRAAYGGGKTLFLRCIEQKARKKNWITAYVMLRRNEVELDKFHTVIVEIAQQLVLPDGSRGLLSLLSSAMLKLSSRAGYRRDTSNSLATLTKVDEMLNQLCLKQGFKYEIAVALRAAMRAFIDADEPFLQQIANWLGGGTDNLEIDPSRLTVRINGPSSRAQVVRLKPLGIGTADQLLRVFAFLTSESGHTGLYLAFDELELIAGLQQKRRDNSFQTIRALIDQTDSRLMPQATCICFAATPLMFEDPKMFPSYKALQDRIETVPTLAGNGNINYWAPVIDLDKTELTKDELLLIAKQMTTLFALAGGTVTPAIEEIVLQIVDALSSTKYLVAKPRLLSRCVIDALDGTLKTPVSQHLAMVNQQMQTNRTKEIFNS
jgi:hypothetical protein